MSNYVHEKVMKLKNRLITRILAFTLACTILSSDIFAYAASETIQEETVVEEQQGQEEASEQRELVEAKLEDITCLLPSVETSAMNVGMYSMKTFLKDENAIEWIDRLDLSDVGQLREFYDILAEASDNDGENDYLIKDEYFTTGYKLPVAEVTGNVQVPIADPANTDLVSSTAANAASSAAGDDFDKYSPYIMAVRDAFDRDYPEVFWLSGETAIGGQIKYGYYPPTNTDTNFEVSYTLSIYMTLKNRTS